MRHIIRNLILSLGLVALLTSCIFPPEKQIRLGKDLRGGTTLVYGVQIGRGEDPRQVLRQTIDVLKERVDPQGQFDIQMVAQGQDRIEITMPLPGPRVLELRRRLDDAIAALAGGAVTADQLERAMRLPPDQRAERIAQLAGDDPELRERLAAVEERLAEAARLRARYDELIAQNPDDPSIGELEQAVVDAEIALDQARAAALARAIDPDALRRALELPDRRKILLDNQGRPVPIPSPREQRLEEIREQLPEDRLDEFQAVLDAYDAYAAERTSLDDPSDLMRLLAGSGVLSFRIAVDADGSGPKTHPEERRLRQELRENGPRASRARDARWFRINQPTNFYDTVAAYEWFRADPVGYFADRYGYVVEPWNGEYWMLLWDTPSDRLTQQDGSWGLRRAFRTQDERGLPAIGFEMNATGAVRLGNLTRPNVGNAMAVLLDDEVYTAPNLLDAISRNGIITGDFSADEINYVVRTLTAGSLQAQLSPEPISVNTVAPSLGADNLRNGMIAGIAALITVSVFMVCYYFGFGVVAVVALICNALLIVGIMALTRAAFTMPGIAGIILTFGMAVDANVLIYERIREELRRGLELRNASRLGFQQALSSIVDGNVTNLIVCIVLGFLGTQEIRGFAITMSVGVLTTLFTALVVSRLLLALLTETVRIKKMRMLPMAIPAIEKALHPKIDWIGLRFIFVTVSALYLAAGVVFVGYQGKEMFDLDFRGGTAVTIQLKPDPAATPAPGEAPARLTLTRQDVQDRLASLGRDDAASAALQGAQILPINPAADGVTSDTFQIKVVGDAVSQSAVLAAVVDRFGDVIENVPPLRFAGDTIADAAEAPVFPVLENRLGPVIGRPALGGDVSDFRGGLAIVLENIQPRATLESIERRIASMRAEPAYADARARQVEIQILAGSDQAVESAVVLVRDPELTYFDGPDTFRRDVMHREWQLVRDALGEATTLASVQAFSPAIAAAFQQTAVVSITLSLLLILIYIWVRFGNLRYSFAAVVCLVHDCIAALGLIALIQILFEIGSVRPFLESLLLQPFRIDLNLVAAMLTIIGYSLNDTIVIMDRIRENRGKLPYASREVINDSINQTLSRTAITSGTTILASAILYIYGGAGVRAFAFTLTVGVLVGTYSSVAIAAPLVWSRRPGGAQPKDTALRRQPRLPA